MEDKLLEDSDEQPGRAEIIVFAVFFEGGLAPFSLFLGWLLSHPALGSFTWNGRDAVWESWPRSR